MQFEFEMKFRDQQKDIQDLAKRQDALGVSLGNVRFDIDFLKSMRGFDDSSKKLGDLETKLSDTEEKLRRAERAISDLDLRLMSLEAQRIQPKASSGKPKAQIKSSPAATDSKH